MQKQWKAGRKELWLYFAGKWMAVTVETGSSGESTESSGGCWQMKFVCEVKQRKGGNV